MVLENEDNFQIDVTFLPLNLCDRLHASLNGSCKVLASEIGFEARERFIPLHKRTHSLRAVVDFVGDMLNELRLKTDKWEQTHRALLSIEPSYKDLRLAAQVLEKGVQKSFISARRNPSVLSEPISHDPSEFAHEASSTAKMKKASDPVKEYNANFTREEFLKLRTDMRKRMRAIGLHDSELRDYFQLPVTQMAEIMNRPFNLSGTASRTGFMMVYNRVLTIEKQIAI